VNASSRELFYKLLWGFGSFILFLVFVYWFLSGGSLESLVGPHFVYFVSLILSFLSFLTSVNFAFEVLVDLKSLWRKSLHGPLKLTFFSYRSSWFLSLSLQSCSSALSLD
jgi:hypothetical protein